MNVQTSPTLKSACQKFGLGTLLISLIACAPSSESQADAEQETPNVEMTKKVQEGWKVIDEADYALQYPGDWELNQSGAMGTQLVVLAPLASDEDQFRENVNMVTEQLPSSDITLDQYSELSLGQLERGINDFQMLENERVDGSPYPYHRMVFTGSQGIYELKFEQHYRVVADKAYVLTFTGEIAQFDAYADLGHQVMGSFVIK